MMAYLIRISDGSMYVSTPALSKRSDFRRASDDEVAAFLGQESTADEPVETEPSVEDSDAAGEDAEESIAGEGGENPDGEDLSDMHWRQLKKMVEEAGGEWTNKADAIAFLEGSEE